ncbi:hypothetical protein BKA83DRAFT_4490333 [Pisolithus microcarpus]|nr:hypothetical protein BKA83DRAFT_4490333 [Pisolithus microcarpus]
MKSLHQFAKFQRLFIPKESKLNSKALDGAFKMMAPKLKAVISHAYHGPKLNAMLKEWVNLSMMGYTPVGHPAATHEGIHFNIILD